MLDTNDHTVRSALPPANLPSPVNVTDHRPGEVGLQLNVDAARISSTVPVMNERPHFWRRVVTAQPGTPMPRMLLKLEITPVAATLHVTVPVTVATPERGLNAPLASGTTVM